MTKSPSGLTFTATLSTIFLLIAMLSGCSQYAVTFNEQLVYSPPPLITDIAASDPRLRACLEQTIQDQQITDPKQLESLTCTYAGITTLAGIEQFDRLRQLNVANNRIIDLAPLSRLDQLTFIDAKENQLQNAAAMLSLLQLKKADLSLNPNLACRDLHQLAKNFAGELVLPTHCGSAQQP